MDVINLDSLKSALRAGTLEVTFRKVNGDLRVMTCTTNLDLIPPSAWPVGSNHSQVDEEEQHRRNVRVYDVNAAGWRSFIFDNVIEVKAAKQ